MNYRTPRLLPAVCVVCALAIVMGLVGHGDAIAATPRQGPGGQTRKQKSHRLDERSLQAMIDELRDSLGILEIVDVAIVPGNPLMLSVESLNGRSGPFRISVDETFMAVLSEEEMNSALAHELGHVWIHTHHPYLQTERLANTVAMRVVSRDSLVPVYHKVWERLGTKGDLAEFLGQ